MSKRSCCAVLLAAMLVVLAAGPGPSAAWAQGSESNPFSKGPTADVAPAKPKGDPFAKKAGTKASPRKVKVRAAKVVPQRPEGKAVVMPKVRLRYGEKAVMQALAEPTEMEFIETPLADVVAYLQEKHRIHIRLDKKALDDVGIGTDTPINFTISGVPLETALDLMLRDLDLTWTVARGVLLITTPEQAETMLFPRVYDVTDLVFPVGDKP